jgi:YD repeat-containing protein
MKIVRNRLSLIFACVLLFVIGVDSSAHVTLQNGNFFIVYTDKHYPGGIEFKIDRTYNSKTPHIGVFGRGWGSELETSLSPSADGSVVITEYGGGSENIFTPVNFKKEDREKGIKAVLEAARKSGSITGTAQFKQYEERLRSDAHFRHQEWEKYVKNGTLERQILADGTQLQSNKFSFQYVTVRGDNYIRTFDNGRVETFNKNGQLTQIFDRNKNFVKFSYDRNGVLQQAVDNQNRKAIFKFNNRGLLTEVHGESGQKATYVYDDQNRLIQSTDAASNVYKYGYDKEHNLTQVAYADGTNLQVAYHGRDKHHSVKRLKDRQGLLTEYDYEFKNNNDHRIVSVVVKGADGSTVLSTSKYEYVYARKANGEPWTQRMVTDVDGVKTDTVYHEQFGLPIKITRNGREASFKYDPRGRVVEKDNPYENVKLAYHSTLGKVIRAERTSKLVEGRSSVSEFQYDKTGNLTAARAGERSVRLMYDKDGRIQAMADNQNRRLQFKYDEQSSRPIEIIDPKLGSIKVTYTNSGDIQNVESPAGRQIASQVTSAFQDLLDIIRPAGVTLSF